MSWLALSTDLLLNFSRTGRHSSENVSSAVDMYVIIDQTDKGGLDEPRWKNLVSPQDLLAECQAWLKDRKRRSDWVVGQPIF